MDREFVTALNCIDGRVQEPVIDYLRDKYNAEYVDDVTYPGIDKVLADDQQVVEEIRNAVTVSIDKHKSRLIALVGHHDCTTNQVSKSHHISQIREAVELIKEWDLGVRVVGLFINEDWEVEPVE